MPPKSRLSALGRQVGQEDEGPLAIILQALDHLEDGLELLPRPGMLAGMGERRWHE